MRTLVNLALLLLAVAACSPRQDLRGAVVDPERLAAIRVGDHGQSQVLDLLGTPTATSTFAERNRTWYYITKETETLAFFRETTLNQQVVAVEFDEANKVKEVRKYEMKDGKPVDVVDRATPTKGRELGLLEQLFGNVGRFNDRNTGSGSQRR